MNKKQRLKWDSSIERKRAWVREGERIKAEIARIKKSRNITKREKCFRILQVLRKHKIISNTPRCI